MRSASSFRLLSQLVWTHAGIQANELDVTSGLLFFAPPEFSCFSFFHGNSGGAKDRSSEVTSNSLACMPAWVQTSWLSRRNEDADLTYDPLMDRNTEYSPPSCGSTTNSTKTKLLFHQRGFASQKCSAPQQSICPLIGDGEAKQAAMGTNLLVWDELSLPIPPLPIQASTLDRDAQPKGNLLI